MVTKDTGGWLDGRWWRSWVKDDAGYISGYFMLQWWLDGGPLTKVAPSCRFSTLASRCQDFAQLLKDLQSSASFRSAFCAREGGSNAAISKADQWVGKKIDLKALGDELMSA